MVSAASDFVPPLIKRLVIFGPLLLFDSVISGWNPVAILSFSPLLILFILCLLLFLLPTRLRSYSCDLMVIRGLVMRVCCISVYVTLVSNCLPVVAYYNKKECPFLVEEMIWAMYIKEQSCNLSCCGCSNLVHVCWCGLMGQHCPLGSLFSDWTRLAGLLFLIILQILHHFSTLKVKR